MRKILRRALAIVLTAVTIVQPMAGYPSIAKAADDNALRQQMIMLQLALTDTRLVL